MWKKPWTLKEGFLIGAGLIVTGLLLELTVGAVEWDVFAWPTNIIVLAVFVLLIIAAYCCRSKVYAFRFLGTFQAAVPALAYAVALTIVMGLTRQTIDGRGLNNMLSLNHLGLFIALTCATLGNADMQRLKMLTTIDQVEWRALDADMNLHELPLAIELKKFIMEVYDDGSPKRFASEIQIMTKKGKNFHTTVDVNKPAEVEGWKIYQFGYDTNAGADSRISILELVRDPWLPAVYTGIGMMLLGALSMFILAQRKK